MNWRLFIYVFVWSIGLFLSTFYSDIVNCIFGVSENVVQNFMMPIIIVVALYLWDEMENIENSTITKSKLKQQFRLSLLFLGFTILLLGIIGLVPESFRWWAVTLCWVMVSVIKYISMYYSNSKIDIKKV